MYQGAYGTQLPFTGSHEPAGTIVALGPSVPSSWSVGTRVGVLNFRKPCDACSGCKWRAAAYGSLDARYCDNKTMSGILKADGGFAEYMVASHYALVRLPDSLSFDQAAPLMCAGVCFKRPRAQHPPILTRSTSMVGIKKSGTNLPPRQLRGIP